MGEIDLRVRRVDVWFKWRVGEGSVLWWREVEGSCWAIRFRSFRVSALSAQVRIHTGDDEKKKRKFFS